MEGSSDSGGSTPPPYASLNFANVVSAVRELKHPSEIGPYSIREVIGEGGMGTIYRAEQRAPIRRTVAIKVIKLGMNTREVIARFESERQALALMDHPNVAKVLDASATDTGQPYFVMEYVKGEPITVFADRHRLTVRERLDLFRQACAAVQHAHQKAIIHRDLKPSNILVALIDDKPQVKVIDFGVAKAISQRLTERTLFTETGQLVGTPEYMAPEQAEGSALFDVDTRSDVYSLGVVLYELLSGALPFDAPTLRSGGYLEIQRIIREVDPPRLSTRLSRRGGNGEEIARLRRTQLDTLARQLRGELEWIPLKAMHKDRARRYSSAMELSEDIDNYLEGRPLRAGPDSAGYRVQKMLRRNKGAVAAAVAVVVVLFVGVAATSWQAIRATRAEASIRAEQERTLEQKREAERQRTEAEAARAAAQQVNTFLTDMLRSADPREAQGNAVLVRDVLDKASEGVATKLAGQPRVEAAVRMTLADTYISLALYGEAEPHILRGLSLFRETGGENDPEALEAQQRLGLLRRRQGLVDEALALYQDTLERRRRVLGEDHLDTVGSLNDMAVVLQNLNRVDEAEAYYREAGRRFRALSGPDDPETLRVAGNLGQLLNSVGRYKEAEALLRESYEGRQRVLGPDHPDTIGIQSQLANTIRALGKYDEAERLMRDAVERSRRVFGEDHPYAIWATQGLAIVISNMGQYDEAIELYRDALARSRRSLGEDHIDTLVLMRTFADELMHRGRVDEAEPLVHEAMAGHERWLAPDHPRRLMALHSVVLCYQLQDRWEQSLPHAKELYERLLDPERSHLDPRQRAQYLTLYGLALAKLERYDEALGPLQLAQQALTETPLPRNIHLVAVLKALVKSNQELGRTGDAARWAAQLEPLEEESAATTTAPSTTAPSATAPGAAAPVAR